PGAIRFRFMCSIKVPSDSLLNYLAEADGTRHVALIVTQQLGNGERIVGEGRYAVFSERRGAADIALLVLDELQHRRIGALLISRLMQIACSATIVTGPQWRSHRVQATVKPHPEKSRNQMIPLPCRFRLIG